MQEQRGNVGRAKGEMENCPGMEAAAKQCDERTEVLDAQVGKLQKNQPSDDRERLALEAALVKLQLKTKDRQTNEQNSIDKAAKRAQERLALIADIRQELAQLEAATVVHVGEVQKAYKVRRAAAEADEERARQHDSARLEKLRKEAAEDKPKRETQTASSASTPTTLAIAPEGLAPAAHPVDPVVVEFNRTVDASEVATKGTLPAKHKKNAWPACSSCGCAKG